jgi:hypothetical protein
VGHKKFSEKKFVVIGIARLSMTRTVVDIQRLSAAMIKSAAPTKEKWPTSTPTLKSHAEQGTGTCCATV